MEGGEVNSAKEKSKKEKRMQVDLKIDGARAVTVFKKPCILGGFWLFYK